MGTGASDEIKPFDLSSSQKTEWISVSIEATLAISSSGLAAPGIIETAACANGNCKAASAVIHYMRTYAFYIANFVNY